jgi:Ca2+/Na+ antiporter
MFGSYCCYIGFMVINPKIVEMLGGEPGAAVETYTAGDVETGDKKPEDAKEETPASPGVAVITVTPEEDGKEETKENGSKPAVGSLQLPGAAPASGTSPAPSPRQPKFSLAAVEHDELLEERRKSKEVAEEEKRKSKEVDGEADAPKNEEPKEAAKEGEEEEDEELACMDKYDPISMLWRCCMPSKKKYWQLFFWSVFSIMLLSYVMVDATVRMGYILNIPTFVMGLLFLAAGTSIPDALASIAVAKQGEGNMAISNALGSNVFDILLGLGVPWTLGILTKGENIYFPGSSDYLMEWIIILTLVVVVFFLVLILNRWKLTRNIGLVFFSCYFIYVGYAVARNYV